MNTTHNPTMHQTTPLAPLFTAPGTPTEGLLTEPGGHPLEEVSGVEFFTQPPAPDMTFVQPTFEVLSKKARALGLFVVRESDQWDLELFNAMREHTYQNLRAIAEVDAIRKVGLAPLEGDSFVVPVTQADGSVVETRVLVEVIQEGKTRAYLFHFGGYWHLWSRASAYKVETQHSDDRLNAFTKILIDVITRIRPVSLYAANLSRLVRSTSQGNRLAWALDGNVDYLWVKEMKFELVGPQKQIAFMVLYILSWTVAMERDAIVMRLLTGRIAKWRRGEWPYGHGTIPFGYKLGADKKLIPDESKREAVRQMMLILVGDAPDAEKVRQLSDAGVTAMRVNRRTKQKTPLAALSSPDYALTTLYNWAPLWISGEYLWRVTNGFIGMDELAGVPIVRHVDENGEPRTDDVGEMQMLYKVGTPEGGWAEPEVVSAFAAAAAAHSVSLLGRGRTDDRPISATVQSASNNPGLFDRLLAAGHAQGRDHATEARRSAARSKKTMSAFTGRGWVDENGHHHELQTTKAGDYRLVRWVLEEDEVDASSGRAGCFGVTP